MLTAPIAQVNLYECKAFNELGDHFHTGTTEYFMLIEGSLEIGNEYGFTKLEPFQTFAVYPTESHRVRVTPRTKFLTFLSRPFNSSSPDLHKSLQ